MSKYTPECTKLHHLKFSVENTQPNTNSNVLQHFPKLYPQPPPSCVNIDLLPWFRVMYVNQYASNAIIITFLLTI